MAINILLGKTRYAARSDRERERLQAQISCYALRFNADKDIEMQGQFLRKQEATLQESGNQIESLCRLVDRYIEIVDRVFAQCGVGGKLAAE